jgi:hypothetical protein
MKKSHPVARGIQGSAQPTWGTAMKRLLAVVIATLVVAAGPARAQGITSRATAPGLQPATVGLK